MALKPCPNCGNHISDKANKCPKCGAELSEKSFLDNIVPKENKERSSVNETTIIKSKARYNSWLMIVFSIIVIGGCVLYFNNKLKSHEALNEANIEENAELTQSDRYTERQRETAEQDERKTLLNSLYYQIENIISDTIAEQKKGESYNFGGIQGYYFTTDLDADNIPEFWLATGTCNADATLSIYMNERGNLKKIKELDGAFDSSFFADKEGVIVAYGHGGYGCWTLYTLKSGQIKEEIIFEENLFETGAEDYTNPQKSKANVVELSNLAPLRKEFDIK